MLVLSRHRDESLTITVDGTTFTILVTRIVDGRAYLGIEAPPNVIICRTELIGTPQGQPRQRSRRTAPAIIRTRDE